MIEAWLSASEMMASSCVKSGSAVGVEAGGVEDRILRSEIVGDGLLELLVDILAAADEADRRHAEAAAVHRLLGSLDQPRIVRQAEVVVGAEVQHLAACHFDFGALGRLDDPLALVKSGRLDLCEFLPEIILDFSVHYR